MKFLGSIGFPHAAPARMHAERHVRGGEIVVDTAELRGRSAEAKPGAPPAARDGTLDSPSAWPEKLLGDVVDLDGCFRRLTTAGNSALAAGDDAEAARLYGEALAEADRLFGLALAGGGAASSPAAALLAPMAHTIACHNAAELRRRGRDRAGALGLELKAVERLVGVAERPASPFLLRVNCMRHTRFALAFLAEHLRASPPEATPADRHAIAALLARAQAAAAGVARVAAALAAEPGGGCASGAREAEPADVALAALLLARAAPTIARMIEAVGGLVGVAACHAEDRS